MADMIVSGAGTSAVNGTYAEYGTRNSKPRYRMASTGSASGYFWIAWALNYWCISVQGADGVADMQVVTAARYYSQENVATPDLVATWAISQGASPVPTVTASGGSAGVPKHFLHYARLRG